MFFSQIKNTKHKELALELAYLVAVSEDRLTKHSNDEYKILFKEYISNDEINTLNKYAEETNCKIFLKKLLSGDDVLANRLRKNSSTTVKKYSNISEVKKEIINNITNKGFDILTITPDLIEKEISNLPKIKAEILRDTAQQCIEIDGKALTSTEKKIILAELLGMAHSNGVYSSAEFELIKYICQQLNLDEEYIDEFSEATKQISLAMKEIIELINE